MQESEGTTPAPQPGGMAQIAHAIGGVMERVAEAEALATLRDSLPEIINAAQTGQEAPAHGAVWQELPPEQLPAADAEDGGFRGAGLGEALAEIMELARDIAPEIAAASGIAPLLGQATSAEPLELLDSSEPIVEAIPDVAPDTEARWSGADGRSGHYSSIDAALTTDPDDVVPIAGVVHNPSSPAADAAPTDTDDDVIEATESDEPADFADEPVAAEAEAVSTGDSTTD